MKPSLQALLLTIVTLSFALIPSAPAAPGDVDAGFNPNADNQVFSTALQIDGKIVIGGRLTAVGAVARNHIARLNADGTLDTGFNPNADSLVYSTAAQADGKIVIAGSFTRVGGVARNGIARLNADGTLDAGFNPNASGEVQSTALQADGKIVIGGFFTSVGGVTRIFIARLNADGTLDAGFNPNVNGPVVVTALQADGKIVIGGQFNGIVRLNADGTLDAGFNANVDSEVFSTAVQPDGKIVIGGRFTTAGGVARNNIARLNADGTLDTGFNPNANNFVLSTAVQADGKIVIGGFFTTIGGVTRNRIARLNADGTLDAGFNPNVDGPVFAPAVQADGKIVIGGAFGTVGGVTRFFIARLENDAATQSLTIPSNARVQWARGGASPEVEQVTFEVSTDGSSYTPLGFGTRITGGWERTGLSLPPTGFIRARGRTNGGRYNGSSGLVEEVAPFGFAGAPTVTTGSATGVTTAAATLGGTVNPNGSATTAFFEYGQTTSYGSTTAVQSLGSGSSTVPASATLSGLTPDTLYHFRLTASNPNGAINGADMTFVTAGSPVVTTGPATNVATTGATLSGTVNPNGVLVTSAIFEYGLTTSYGSSVSASPAPGSGTAPVAVSATLSGLASNQTYHFRLTATNSVGTSSGVDGTFLTGAGAPTATTGGSSNISASGATISGTVNPNGSATTATFEYGLDTTYGSTATATPPPGSGTAPVTVGATIAGLSPNRTYHYRLTANSQGGFASGTDAAFTTSAILPSVQTQPATNVTTGGANLHGLVNPNHSATTARFEYGITTDYGSSVAITPAPGSGDQPLAVSAFIGGLQPNQTYHFRLAATNQAGTAGGVDLTFTTGASPPTTITGPPTNVINTGATVNGTVNPNGSLITSAVFEIGLTTSYGTSVNVTTLPGEGRAPVNVSTDLSGLQPNQTFHYRLTSANSAGTSSGSDGTFTTGATAPAVTTGAPSNVTSTGATLGGTVSPNGSATTATFEYGLDTNYGSSASASPAPGSGTEPVAVSAILSGLIPNRTYHYRLTATSAGGFVAGSDATFVTPALLPTVQTLPESGVTTTGATLHGTVNPNGAATTVRFAYGVPGALIQQTQIVDVGNGTSEVPISATISNLEPSKNYEYRIEATNSVGTALGNIEPFKTELTEQMAVSDQAFAVLGGPEFDIEVLDNDQGDGLVITALSTNLGGRVSISAGQRIKFRPLAAGGGSESFDYTVRDLAANEATATVTVHYFIALRGTYYQNLTVAPGRLLRLRLDLDFAGIASGRLEWEGEQYPFKVQFDGAGTAEVAKARADEQSATLFVDLALDPAPGIAASFRDTGSAPVTEETDLAFVEPNPDAVPAKGLRIAFIDPGESGAGAAVPSRGAVVDPLPEGIGFSQVRITRKGGARFITKMPDFGAFSNSGRLETASGGKLPRYSLDNGYSRKGDGKLGEVFGDVLPGRDDQGLDRVFGALDWKRNRSDGSIDFLIALLEGFRYQPRAVAQAFPPNKDPNATVTLSGGGLETPIIFNAAIKGGKFLARDPIAGSLGLNLKMKLKEGVFSGSFTLPGGALQARMMGGIAGEVGFRSALSLQEPRLRGTFFVKETKRTGRIEIKRIP